MSRTSIRPDDDDRSRQGELTEPQERQLGPAAQSHELKWALRRGRSPVAPEWAAVALGARVACGREDGVRPRGWHVRPPFEFPCACACTELLNNPWLGARRQLLAMQRHRWPHSKSSRSSLEPPSTSDLPVKLDEPCALDSSCGRQTPNGADGCAGWRAAGKH